MVDPTLVKGVTPETGAAFHLFPSPQSPGHHAGASLSCDQTVNHNGGDTMIPKDHVSAFIMGICVGLTIAYVGIAFML
jgi:hypothetical protein